MKSTLDNPEWLDRLEKAQIAYLEKFGTLPEVVDCLNEDLPERFENAVKTGKELPDEELG